MKESTFVMHTMESDKLAQRHNSLSTVSIIIRRNRSILFSMLWKEHFFYRNVLFFMRIPLSLCWKVNLLWYSEINTVLMFHVKYTFENFEGNLLRNSFSSWIHIRNESFIKLIDQKVNRWMKWKPKSRSKVNENTAFNWMKHVWEKNIKDFLWMSRFGSLSCLHFHWWWLLHIDR